MLPTKNVQANRNYQAEVAEALLKHSSRDDAIRFCMENHWAGVLDVLKKMQDVLQRP